MLPEYIPERGLPLNKPLLIKAEFKRSPSKFSTGIKKTFVARVLITHKVEHFFEIIAVDGFKIAQQDFWRLYTYQIESWEHYPVKDLPLLMGWEYTTPLLSKLIKGE
jgi:hypothetical protein